MSTNLTAMKGKVLLVAKKSENVTESGIVLDENETKKQILEFIVASVLPNDDNLKVGDVVLVSKQDLKPVTISLGQKMLYTDIKSVLAVLGEETTQSEGE